MSTTLEPWLHQEHQRYWIAEDEKGKTIDTLIFTPLHTVLHLLRQRLRVVAVGQYQVDRIRLRVVRPRLARHLEASLSLHPRIRKPPPVMQIVLVL
ncbi:hypothetical protein EV714DRAFT_278465 [Schizophyllum commune]